MQPALATTGYIRQSSKLDIEQQDFKTLDILAQPFDFLFDPDPTTCPATHTPCPYATIGADITIAHSCAATSTFEFLENAIPSLIAIADTHLQKFERKKNVRGNKQDDSPDQNRIDGDQVI